jgi:quinol monooxygenase YgiN
VADLTELTAIARLKFHEGKLEEFKRASAEVIEIVRAKDTGTLQYDIYVNDEQTECVFLERYENLDAMIEHNAHLGDALGEMLATGSLTAELFIEPSDDIKAKFAGLPIRFFTPLLSM